KPPLRLVGPRGSSCVPRNVQLYTALACYLPELIEPGSTSKTWGVTNPFRISATSSSTRPGRPYELSIVVNSAGAWNRNVGMSSYPDGPRPGTWLIRPTVPLTTTVTGNGTSTQDALVLVSGAAGAADADSVDEGGDSGSAGQGEADAAGLPITGASAALSAGVGLSTLILGVCAVVAARRRRRVS
ncbi:MAG TPA: LPXTG cell wall anchor domain-containing protein, partial [Actinoplanes sp.]|nr:LPXTG cell wall anchor domain-containing protein [Actinoplanes sp.]